MLGIPPTADKDTIREAYLARVKEHHPDRYRLDPSRYRQQEEMMKRINFAYEWALRHPPTTTAPGPTHPPGSDRQGQRPDPPIMCPDHGYQAMGRCKRCGQPLCLGCLGFRRSLCNRHYQRQKIRAARSRTLGEWGPLIVIIFGLRALGLPGFDVAIAVLIYLALLGLRLLIRRHWLGCLALLLLPYSLVLAGVWSLWESLRDWNGHPSGKAKAG
ncbi:J domain-containing protein [Sulfobacillus harzensis]|uniref:J domain-containing protein n=1 Tax=Sulfobacillus harzensis TaxID=2729629 RepID=UPI0030843FE1